MSNNQNTIVEFVEKIRMAIQDYYGELVEVVVHEVSKNNGLELYGIVILENGSNISPTIYINQYFEKYKDGEAFSNLVMDMIDTYEKNRITCDLDINFFSEYKKVKPKIVYKLINYQKNIKRLQNIPYRKFLDLAIICQCMVKTEAIGDGAILIHHNHLAMWNVDEDTLFQDAAENTWKYYKIEVQNMNDLIQEWFEYENKTEVLKIKEKNMSNEEILRHTIKKPTKIENGQQVTMYILTNREKINGATTILYPGILEMIGDIMETDYYILPSSIHELIVVPNFEEADKTKFNEMVQEVNETQLEQEEILADHAYYYSRKRKQLGICL